MTCANTSLPAYIRCSRDGFPRRVANLATAVQVGDRQNHEKVLSVPWLTSCSLENVGTLLICPNKPLLLNKALRMIVRSITYGRAVGIAQQLCSTKTAL